MKNRPVVGDGDDGWRWRALTDGVRGRQWEGKGRRQGLTARGGVEVAGRNRCGGGRTASGMNGSREPAWCFPAATATTGAGDGDGGGVGAAWRHLCRRGVVRGNCEMKMKIFTSVGYIPRALVPVRGTNRDQCPPLVPVGATNREQWPCTTAWWWEFSPTSLVESARTCL